MEDRAGRACFGHSVFSILDPRSSFSLTMPDEIQLVLFDLGRVLIQLCDDWKHACRVAGVVLPECLTEPDEASHARAHAVIERYDTGQIDGVTFAQEIAPLRGLAPEQVMAFHNCFLRGPYPGAVELLDKL